MKHTEILPSERISEFLDWLKECQNIFDEAVAVVENESDKEQDFLHAMEFETNGNKLAKIAREMHESRVTRRKAKEVVEKYNKLVKFTRNETNKKFIGQFKGLVREIKADEERLALPRRYHPRTEYGKELLKDCKYVVKEGDESGNDIT